MTDSYSKRKWAGEPIKDKKKVVPEPPKHGKKAKPKVYVLHSTEFVRTVRTYIDRYPTAKARDQARTAYRRRIEGDEARRKGWYKQPDRYELSVTFGESEE